MNNLKPNIGYIGNSQFFSDPEYSNLFNIKKISLIKKINIPHYSTLIVDHDQLTNSAIKKYIFNSRMAAFVFLHDNNFFHPPENFNLIFPSSSVEEIVDLIFSAIEFNKKIKNKILLEKVGKNDPYSRTNELIKKLMLSSNKIKNLKDLCKSIEITKPDLLFNNLLIITLDGKNSVTVHSSGFSKTLPLTSEVKKIFKHSTLDPKKIDSNAVHFFQKELNIEFHEAIAISSVKEKYLFLFTKNQIFNFSSEDLKLIKIIFMATHISMNKMIASKISREKFFEWSNTFDSISEPISVVDNDLNLFLYNKSFKRNDKNTKDTAKKFCYSLLAKRKTACENCPKGSKESKIINTPVGFFLVSSYSIPDNTNNLSIQFYRDLTKEAKLTSAFLQSEKMVALGALVQAISHEISNPITAIMSLSQILISKSDFSNLHEELHEILAAAIRSKQTLKNLLDFTTDSITEKMSLLEIINNSISFSKTIFNNISLKKEVPSNIFLFNTNISAIQQIIFNLIKNAVEAMPTSGTLEISAILMNDNVLITIKDSGKGISKENIKKIFDPFFTDKKDGEGTGLGLMIVKNLLQKMSGTIKVNSQIGKGTTFQISLPINGKAL